MNTTDRVTTRSLREKLISKPADSQEYFVPSAFILKMLGIRETDLKLDTVNIRTASLRALIQEFAAKQRVDEEFYIDHYKDIKGAQLAGLVASPRTHFEEVGYLEGRLPRDLDFDPEWYFDHYSDLAGAFSRSDVEGLRNHFFTVGYLEGRAGTMATQAQAEMWQARIKG